MDLATLDAACAAHLQHGAMALDDPLSCALADQCCAPEGALPYITGTAGLTPAQRQGLADAQQDPWLWRVLAAGAVLGVLTGGLTAADLVAYVRGWLA